MMLLDDDEGEDKMTLPINNMRVAVEKVEPAPPPPQQQLPVVVVGVDVVCAARDRFLLPNCCGALDAAVVAEAVLCLLHATAAIVRKS